MTQPGTDPSQMSDEELTQAIITASRAYIAAQTARPRNAQRIADARAWLDDLIAERDARSAT